MTGDATGYRLDAPRWLIASLAVLAIAGFPASLWFQGTGADKPLDGFVLAGASAFAAALALVLRTLPGRGLPALSERLVVSRIPLPAVLMLGLALRLTAALGLSPQPASDGASYLALARQLVEMQSYGHDGARAFWPPGFPLLLASLLYTGMAEAVAVVLVGVLTYLATTLGVLKLSASLGLERWSLTMALLLAIWPSYVLCAALPEKELVVAALLPWILVHMLAAFRGSSRAAMFAGLLLGAAVLVQPSLQLLPLLMLPLALWRGPSRWRALARVGLMVLAAGVVVAPWTIRNLNALGHPVLVSTNGGDVLYRANNELATGAYRLKGAVDLSHLSELAIDQESKRLAAAWILGHPSQFLQLSLGRALLFMGEDSYGAFAVFQRGGVEVHRATYLGVKLLSNLPWLALWGFVLACAVRREAWPPQHDPLALGLVLMPPIYLLAIHAVFESGPKYHLPLIPLMLLAAAAGARGLVKAPKTVS